MDAQDWTDEAGYIWIHGWTFRISPRLTCWFCWSSTLKRSSQCFVYITFGSVPSPMCWTESKSNFIQYYLIFGYSSSGMEIYSKMQDPLSPSNKKIGGENVEFKSKCLKICQEAALFWLTHGLLDFWTRTHEDYFVIED